MHHLSPPPALLLRHVPASRCVTSRFGQRNGETGHTQVVGWRYFVCVAQHHIWITTWPINADTIGNNRLYSPQRGARKKRRKDVLPVGKSHAMFKRFEFKWVLRVVSGSDSNERTPRRHTWTGPLSSSSIAEKPQKYPQHGQSISWRTNSPFLLFFFAYFLSLYPNGQLASAHTRRAPAGRIRRASPLVMFCERSLLYIVRWSAVLISILFNGNTK